MPLGGGRPRTPLPLVPHSPLASWEATERAWRGDIQMWEGWFWQSMCSDMHMVLRGPEVAFRQWGAMSLLDWREAHMRLGLVPPKVPREITRTANWQFAPGMGEC